MDKPTVDNLEPLLDALPEHVRESLHAHQGHGELIEILLDLGRPPEARFSGTDISLACQDVTDEDIHYVIDRIGEFGGDNRAGIERTLHRFSAIRNRRGKVIGITCRVGRAVFGTIRPIEGLIATGKGILMLGRPGVGKTTMLREVARVLADDSRKRVVVVDTSNEIAGDGDIPHPGIGRARRMQVPTPALQHDVMIEAVENHMPEVIIIDEMGTELEAKAARTIAERGVQLIATAHGNSLENLLMNPTLSDLVGGVQTVILGDEEARRRRTQKTVLERKLPPTFDIVVEIQDWGKVAIHSNVAAVVDAMLRGRRPEPEVHRMDVPGSTRGSKRASGFGSNSKELSGHHALLPRFGGIKTQDMIRLYPFGVNRAAILRASQSMPVPLEMVDGLHDAQILLTTKAHYRRNPRVLKKAEETGTPVYVLRKNSLSQVEQFIRTLQNQNGPHSSLDSALHEAQGAMEKVCEGELYIELSPQTSYVRRLQHQLASQYNLQSESVGIGPSRRVTVSRVPSER